MVARQQVTDEVHAEHSGTASDQKPAQVPPPFDRCAILAVVVAVVNGPLAAGTLGTDAEVWYHCGQMEDP